MIESCSGHLRDTVTSSLDNIFECVIAKPRARVMNLQHVRMILEELGCEQSIEDQVTFYTIDLKSIIRDCQTDEVEAIVLKMPIEYSGCWQTKTRHLKLKRECRVKNRERYIFYGKWTSATWGKILDDMYHAAANLNQRIVYNYEQDKEATDLPAKLRTNIQKEKYVRYSNRRLVLENALLKIDGLLMFLHDFQNLVQSLPIHAKIIRPLEDVWF